MTRHVCVLLCVFTLAAIKPEMASPIDSERPDFSGTYTLLPDRSVAIWSSGVSDRVPDSTAGRTVVGACGDRFVITQTDKVLTIGVVSGDTAAHHYGGAPVGGTYELDRSTTVSFKDITLGARQGSFRQLATVSWRGASLKLALTQYVGQSREVRADYVFRFKDSRLTVEYLTNTSAHEIVRNWPSLNITSVYEKSAS